MEEIRGFKGPNYFLSNCYPVMINYNGEKYRNAEAAFQAQKDKKMSFLFSDLTPMAARTIGNDSTKINLRKDWEDVKYQIMEDVVRCKFEQNPWLLLKLVHTDDAKLINVNTYRDRYWGVYRDKGLNKLGEILMALREEFKSESR